MSRAPRIRVGLWISTSPSHAPSPVCHQVPRPAGGVRRPRLLIRNNLVVTDSARACLAAASWSGGREGQDLVDAGLAGGHPRIQRQDIRRGETAFGPPIVEISTRRRTRSDASTSRCAT
jgi:hypothetical protein